MEIYKLGSRGEGVKAIQRALHLIDDGVFGKLTREAVITFQKEPLNVKKSKRVITDIVVHCTASTYGRDLSAADIRKSHIKERGWADIGYHYVVRLDGRVEPGRDVDKIGAHVTNHNSHSIGVVYVGGLDKDGKAKDTRTELQKNALLNLLLDLRKLYPKAKISGHRDFSPDKNGDGIISPCEWIKSCPCFDAKREYARV